MGIKLMLHLAIRILAPSGTRRGKKVRSLIKRLRDRRATGLARDRYNLHRQKYYSHTTTKLLKSEPIRISILVPCFNTAQRYFEPLLASIFSQGYSNWELILVDASTDKQIQKYLITRAAADTRIVYAATENEGIAANTNKCIALATGEVLAFLDHDDTLDVDALAEVAEIFANDDTTDLVYSDEDKISEDGERYFNPHFKPDFSIDLLRNVNYITHFVAVKKELATQLKGIRIGFDGAQDYDFLLRAVDNGANIRHIPKILYHWREAEGSTAADFTNKQQVTDAGCRALDDHFARNGINSVTTYAVKNRPGFYGQNYKLTKTTRAIYINLNDKELAVPEREYIINTFRNNKSVKEHDLDVITDEPKNIDTVMTVNGAFVPFNKDVNLANMFGLAEERGVGAVTPAITRNGRIYDMGIVNATKQKVRLFEGLNPEREIPFGSLEWVRNVDELTGHVTIVHNKDTTGRKVVWTHAMFSAFEPISPTKGATHFYSQNVTLNTEMVEYAYDYIEDKVDVKL